VPVTSAALRWDPEAPAGVGFTSEGDAHDLGLESQGLVPVMELSVRTVMRPLAPPVIWSRGGAPSEDVVEPGTMSP